MHDWLRHHKLDAKNYIPAVLHPARVVSVFIAAIARRAVEQKFTPSENGPTCERASHRNIGLSKRQRWDVNRCVANGASAETIIGVAVVAVVVSSCHSTAYHAVFAHFIPIASGDRTKCGCRSTGVRSEATCALVRNCRACCYRRAVLDCNCI